jgi:hypothetical protein
MKNEQEDDELFFAPLSSLVGSTLIAKESIKMNRKLQPKFNWENEFDIVWANKSPQFGYIGTKARQEIKDWIKENVIKKLQNTATIFTIKKDKLNGIGYDFADTFYKWCRRNKIKIEEPKNNKTGLYETFVVHLDTTEKQFLFSNKYLKILK